MDMNIVMQDFLSSTSGSSFVKHAPRPPVPGGETDATVHNCAASTRSSSSSHRSHVSSAKSLSSGKSVPQQSGGISPAATPRKSNLDRTLTTKSGGGGHAPLGFEPEGSVAGSPQFAETSTLGVPPCLRWAENLRCLLEDGEGVKLFKLFLDQELATSAALDFWFACSGLKLVSPINVALVLSLVKLIYKKYVKPCGGDLRVSPEIKQCIVERLRCKQVNVL